MRQPVQRTGLSKRAGMKQPVNLQTSTSHSSKLGDRVEVSGVSVSEKWEKDGKKGSTLVLKATSVKQVISEAVSHTRVGTFEKAVAAPFEAELPF